MLPYSTQWIDSSDIKAVIKVLKSNWLTTGPTIEKFEKKFADFVGAKYAVAVSNGTTALHLAIQVLNIKPLSQGITTPNTFIATANALLYNRLNPIFADINKKTYNINPIEIENKISRKTRLIIPVHFAGQPAEMEIINRLTVNRNIYIIEDAAHALGSKYGNGKRVGSCCYSDMTVFSFHPVKTITCGEGGMITTNNYSFCNRLKILRNHGIVKEEKYLKQNPGPWYYEMQELGENFRLTDIQAALGISQLEKIDKFIKKRREIVSIYNRAFQNIPWLTTQYEVEGSYSVYHLYVICLDFKFIRKSRKTVMKQLLENGIGTQVHYLPVHLHPYYQKKFHYQKGDFPLAENYYQKCLSIPLYPKMSVKDTQKVIRNIKNLVDYK